MVLASSSPTNLLILPPDRECSHSRMLGIERSREETQMSLKLKRINLREREDLEPLIVAHPDDIEEI